MFQQNTNSNESDRILKNAQIEALKSISQLLVREISSLEDSQETVANEISSGNKICLNNEMQKFEMDLIRCALVRTMGKQNAAARLLGLKNSTLSDKIKRYNIDVFEIIS